MPIGILAMGAYVPPNVVSNELIAEWTGVTEGWILERTGIFERRYADSDTPTSELAFQAVQNLVSKYPSALEDVGAIVLATSTPDQPQPPTALILQSRLGLSRVPGFDLNAVCSGGLYGIVVGASLAKEVGRVLVVAADKYSAIMDRRDRRTVSLFGDGAGAVLLGPVPDAYGLHASKLVGDGIHRDFVEVVGGGTRRPLDVAGLEAGEHLFRMRGREVKDYALETLPELIRAVVDEAGLDVHDIDRFILHQANPRLLGDVARTLGADVGRVAMTAPVLGNTGCASILITLCAAHAAQPLKRGERLVFGAIGGGMSAGAAVLTHYRPDA